jgi:methylated-DNA-[protein]-cysteine S-methyltransferase
MNPINIHYYKSPVGEIILGEFKGKLCLADWRYRKMRDQIDSRIQKQLGVNYTEKTTDLHRKAIEQFEEYFLQQRKQFTVPLHFVGTDFQQSVWQALQNIPYGETRSYLELSQEIGNAKAVRAVANANGANAISIIVPCHRIIGTDGKLVGYAGGINVKEKLLNLESDLFSN